MAKSKSKQPRLFSDEDPRIAKVADRYIETLEMLEQTKAKAESIEDELLKAIRGLGRKQIRHNGKLISIRHTEAHERLTVKPLKE